MWDSLNQCTKTVTLILYGWILGCWDLLPLPPWGYLAISVTAVQAHAGQHEVVGNTCRPDTSSSETAVNGVVGQPESDPATTTPQAGDSVQGEPTQAKQDSLAAQKVASYCLCKTAEESQREWQPPALTAVATRKAQSPTNIPTTL